MSVGATKREWNHQPKQRAKNAAYMRRKSCFYLYGITYDEYLVLGDAKDWRCDICNKQSERGNRRKLCIDHNHLTGQIRGLLCQRCNSGIAAFGDTGVGVSNALQYVLKDEGAIYAPVSY
jgi:hypothetical protein